MSDDEDENADRERSEDDSDDDTSPPKKYAFPELDAQIRKAIAQYGAVFPKLNWTSPRVREIKHKPAFRSDRVSLS